MVYSTVKIILGICSNLDEPQKYHLEGKKSQPAEEYRNYSIYVINRHSQLNNMLFRNINTDGKHKIHEHGYSDDRRRRKRMGIGARHSGDLNKVWDYF